MGQYQKDHHIQISRQDLQGNKHLVQLLVFQHFLVHMLSLADLRLVESLLDKQYYSLLYMMLLDEQLQEAVNSQVISVAQAWAMQDLLESTPPGRLVTVPSDWHPWVERLHLWEAEPVNELPL